jgi:hypothetical protein
MRCCPATRRISRRCEDFCDTGQLGQLEEAFASQPWELVRDQLTVKLLAEDGDVYVLTRSGDRVQKERAIRRRKLKRLWRRLNELAAMKRQTHEQLLMRLGAARQEAGQFWKLVGIQTEPFSFTLDRAALRQIRRVRVTTSCDPISLPAIRPRSGACTCASAKSSRHSRN